MARRRCAASSLRLRDIHSFVTYPLRLVENYRAAQYQPALEFNNRNIAGHAVNAKWLLVGDQVNAPDYKKCWPFIEHRRSSLFVAQAMHSLGCREEQFMWTNAVCPEQHTKVLCQPGGPELKPIAFGHKASTYLTGLGLKHASVDHPSHALRFSTISAWSANLRAALYS